MKYLILLVSLLFFRCSSEEYVKNQFIDPRDGKTYNTMKIGDFNWLAEDLKWNDQEAYNYFDALRACPEGWELPTTREWFAVGNSAGGYAYHSDIVGNPNEAFELLTNEEGFNATVGGYYWSSSPAIKDVPSIRSETPYFLSGANNQSVFGVVEHIHLFRMLCRCVQRDKLIKGTFELQIGNGTLNYSSHFEYYTQQDTNFVLHAFQLDGAYDMDWIQLYLSTGDLQKFSNGEVQVPAFIGLDRIETIDPEQFGQVRESYRNRSLMVTLTQYEDNAIAGYFQTTLFGSPNGGVDIEVLNAQFSLDLTASR